MCPCFGNYLKNLREQKELSIRQVSKISGISAGYLSLLETGQRGTPSPKILRKLAPVYKIPYNDLLKKAGYLEAEKKEAGPADDKPIDNHLQETIETINENLKDYPGLRKFLQDLLENEEFKLFFKQERNLGPKEIKTIIATIKALAGEDNSQS